MESKATTKSMKSMSLEKLYVYGNTPVYIVSNQANKATTNSMVPDIEEDCFGTSNYVLFA